MLGKAGLGWFGRVWVVVVVWLSLRVNKKRIVTQEAKGLEKISKNFKHCKIFLKSSKNFKISKKIKKIKISKKKSNLFKKFRKCQKNLAINLNFKIINSLAN